jgi:hypothetical protein
VESVWPGVYPSKRNVLPRPKRKNAAIAVLSDGG